MGGKPKKSGNTAKKAAKKAENKQERFVEPDEMMQQAETEEQLPEIGLEQPKKEQEEEPRQSKEIKPNELPKEADIEVKYNVSNDDTREMMNFVGITSIPKFQESAVWTRAIAKVLKTDTSVSWVVLKRTGAKTHNIEKIFGHCSAIKKVGTPIPIEIIPYNYSAAFPSSSAYAMAKFLSDYAKQPVEELQKKTPGELTEMMLDLQIRMYYEDERKNWHKENV